MHISEKTPLFGEDRVFDYGRSLIYTIYRHASGLPDAEAGSLARLAASRRHGDHAETPDAVPGRLTEGLIDGLAGRLRRLRSPRTLALPA